MKKIIYPVILLAACSNNNIKEADTPLSSSEYRKQNFGKLFGDEFLKFDPLGSNKKGNPGMGANQFLWRASLNTLQFLPLASTDSVGGVITTDWYPVDNNTRLKIMVYITDTVLRADALKVVIVKQVLQKNQWQTCSGNADAARELEDVILSEARRLYARA